MTLNNIYENVNKVQIRMFWKQLQTYTLSATRSILRNRSPTEKGN